MDPLRVEGMFTDQVPCAVVGGETGKEVVDEGASFSAVEADPVKLAQIGHAAVRLSWTATANEIYWIATVHLNAIASGSWTVNANVIETEIEIETETETETETVTVTVTVTAIETGTWTDVIVLNGETNGRTAVQIVRIEIDLVSLGSGTSYQTEWTIVIQLPQSAPLQPMRSLCPFPLHPSDCRNRRTSILHIENRLSSQVLQQRNHPDGRVSAQSRRLSDSNLRRMQPCLFSSLPLRPPRRFLPSVQCQHQSRLQGQPRSARRKAVHRLMLRHHQTKIDHLSTRQRAPKPSGVNLCTQSNPEVMALKAIIDRMIPHAQ